MIEEGSRSGKIGINASGCALRAAEYERNGSDAAVREVVNRCLCEASYIHIWTESFYLVDDEYDAADAGQLGLDARDFAQSLFLDEELLGKLVKFVLASLLAAAIFRILFCFNGGLTRHPISRRPLYSVDADLQPTIYSRLGVVAPQARDQPSADVVKIVALLAL